jgi:hypothetical protein
MLLLFIFFLLGGLASLQAQGPEPCEVPESLPAPLSASFNSAGKFVSHGDSLWILDDDGVVHKWVRTMASDCILQQDLHWEDGGLFLGDANIIDMALDSLGISFLESDGTWRRPEGPVCRQTGAEKLVGDSFGRFWLQDGGILWQINSKCEKEDKRNLQGVRAEVAGESDRWLTLESAGLQDWEFSVQYSGAKPVRRTPLARNPAVQSHLCSVSSFFRHGGFYYALDPDCRQILIFDLSGYPVKKIVFDSVLPRNSLLRSLGPAAENRRLFFLSYFLEGKIRIVRLRIP